LRLNAGVAQDVFHLGGGGEHVSDGVQPRVDQLADDDLPVEPGAELNQVLYALGRQGVDVNLRGFQVDLDLRAVATQVGGANLFAQRLSLDVGIEAGDAKLMGAAGAFVGGVLGVAGGIESGDQRVSERRDTGGIPARGRP